MLLSLTGISAIAALTLAGVKLLTDKPIADAAEQARNEALAAVLPPFDNISAQTTPDGLTVYTATDDDSPSGTAVETFSDNGFGGRITILVGFDISGTICGYRILSHSETPGLGSNMDTWFMAAGTDHNVIGSSDTLKLKADGGEIDAITGATISSRAFIEAVNRARQAVQNTNP